MDNSNNNNNNDRLFFSVWKNIYLKKQIFLFVHLLNQLYDKYEIISISEQEKFKKFNYKQYVKHIKFDQMNDNMLLDVVTNKEYISEMINLKKIEIQRSLKDYSPSVIPDGVECISFPYELKGMETIINSELPISVTRIENANFNTNYKFNSINVSKSIKSIRFQSFNEPLSNCNSTIGLNENEQVNLTYIPNTITDIKFDFRWTNGGLRLKSTDFHGGITKLDLGSYIVKNEEKYSIFPKSLTNLTFQHDNDLIIDNETIPKSVISLDISLNEYYDGNRDINTKGLTILNGSIPNSLTLLSIYTHGIVIEPMVLVNSNITELEIEGSLVSPNEITAGFLPSKLKSLFYSIMSGCKSNDIHPTLIKKGSLPNSLEKLDYRLHFDQFDNSIISDQTTDFKLEKNHFSNNINLTDLKLSNGNNVMSWPVNCLPNTIKSLEILDCNDLEINEPNVIPNGLLYLKFQSINKPILPNVLPSTLESLSFADIFSHNLSFENVPTSIKTIKLYYDQFSKEPKNKNISSCILSSPNIKIEDTNKASKTIML